MIKTKTVYYTTHTNMKKKRKKGKKFYFLVKPSFLLFFFKFLILNITNFKEIKTIQKKEQKIMLLQTDSNFINTTTK